MQDSGITTQMPPRSQGKAPSVEDIHIDDLLRLVVERGGSDLHIAVGIPPVIRIDGQLVPVNYERLPAQDTQRLCYDILSD
ncbi:MAG: hypothetical protein K6U00_14030, partial [Armatimonadetes bacterium]|nr:hypothetical protein [Armatimonadota bacterium]